MEICKKHFSEQCLESDNSGVPICLPKEVIPSRAAVGGADKCKEGAVKVNHKP